MQQRKPNLVWLHSHTLMSTGGTRFIHEVCTRLTKSYTITLFVEKSSEQWYKAFSDHGVTVKTYAPLSSNSLLYWAFFPFFLIYDYLYLKSNVAATDYVISTMFPFNFLGNLVSKKHLYYCFEPFAFFYDDSLKKERGSIQFLLMNFLKLAYSWMDRLGVRKANKLLAINPSVGKHIELVYGRTPTTYTYLGVDTQHFTPRPSKKSKRVTFFHSTDYTPLKGTQFLLDSLPLLQPYANSFVIQISESIPNAALKSELQQKISALGMTNTIQFLGHLPYHQLPEYYSNADAFLFIGSPDSKGASAASLSVLEAQACGLPVLRSIGNTDEIIPQKTGINIDPRNSQQLAAALLDVVKNREKYRAMREACITHVRTTYTWEEVATILSTSIESLQ